MLRLASLANTDEPCSSRTDLLVRVRYQNPLPPVRFFPLYEGFQLTTSDEAAFPAQAH